MAQVSYTQADADWMMSVAKLTERDSTPYFGPDTRSQGGRAGSFSVHSICGTHGATFRVDVSKNTYLESFKIGLSGKMPGRPMIAICRYDIHDTVHRTNCRHCVTNTIWNGDPHVHRYSEHCLRAKKEWDECAVLLSPQNASRFVSQMKSVAGQFFADMSITFTDRQIPIDFFSDGAQ
jgi:hypothetical protein